MAGADTKFTLPQGRGAAEKLTQQLMSGEITPGQLLEQARKENPLTPAKGMQLMEAAWKDVEKKGAPTEQGVGTRLTSLTIEVNVLKKLLAPHAEEDSPAPSAEQIKAINAASSKVLAGVEGIIKKLGGVHEKILSEAFSETIADTRRDAATLSPNEALQAAHAAVENVDYAATEMKPLHTFNSTTVHTHFPQLVADAFCAVINLTPVLEPKGSAKTPISDKIIQVEKAAAKLTEREDPLEASPK